MSSKFKYIIILFLLGLGGRYSFGQTDSLIRCIELENFSLVASSEFNIDLSIKRVKEDTSFYQSFKNYKFYSHNTTGNINVLNRSENIKASERISVSQKTIAKTNVSKLKWQIQKIIKSEGKIKNKKGEYKYLTAELYYETFFPKDTLVVSNQLTSIDNEYVGESKKSQHKHDLKVVMFNPGSDVTGIPIIGKKMSIFDEDMVKYYDYKISKRSFQGEDYYVFSCVAKEEYKADKTVIKYLVTYFNAESMLVMKREYKMKYNSLLFQFDVNIKVENQLKDSVIIPKTILYDGMWDIPFKSSEMFQFDLMVQY